MPASALPLLLLLAGAGGCRKGDARPARRAPAVTRAVVVEVLSRTGKIRQYPCMECHDKIVLGPGPLGPKRKHDHIVTRHFKGAEGCLLCHDRTDMNRLRIMAGGTVSFDASHRVCGQCHGEKHRDWAMGAHGKQVGRWAGKRQRYGCTDCHDAHAPAPPPMSSMPPPPRPARLIPKGDHP